MLQKLNKELVERLKAANIASGPYPLFDLSPQQVQGFLEAAWEVWLRVSSSKDDDVVKARKPSPDAVLPTVGRVDVEFAKRDVITRDVIRGMLGSSSNERSKNDILVAAAEAVLMGQVFDIDPNVFEGDAHVLGNPLRHWDHLMYAYLIENTRVLEICKKLLEDLLSDEVHGPISDETLRWLRSTEDLFFRHGNSSLISSVTSWVRPDLGATRRNAYQRMFGIDLNHGASNGTSYPYARATVANAEFVAIFQDLLRELWRGYVNSRNTSGSNTTDDSNIRELISRLRNMLRARRLSASGQANLAREEFVSVTMMSWFELTVGEGSPVVVDLKAIDSTIEERLRKLGERVKVPMHGKSRSFFTLAGHLPRLLTLIEQGHFEASDDTIRALYAPIPGQPNELQASVLQIINHWSIATGVDLKALPTTTGPR